MYSVKFVFICACLFTTALAQKGVTIVRRGIGVNEFPKRPIGLSEMVKAYAEKGASVLTKEIGVNEFPKWPPNPPDWTWGWMDLTNSCKIFRGKSLYPQLFSIKRCISVSRTACIFYSQVKTFRT